MGVQGSTSGGGRRVGGGRARLVGRAASLFFIVAAIASLPANVLLSNPEPPAYMYAIAALSAAIGVVFLLVPWKRIDRRWLHVIPTVITGQITLVVLALGVHGEIYLWYFALGAIYTA